MATQQVIDYCNKVFLTIGTAFLAEEEKTLLPDTLDDLSAVYTKLFEILQARGEQPSLFAKLNAKAILADVTLPDDTANKQYDSNILLGFGVNV